MSDTDEHADRTHIVSDLMPFICIITPCKEPRDMYRTMETWMSHMMKNHAQDLWTCVHRDHTSDMGFSSEPEFRQHMLKMHKEEVAEEDIDEVVQECHTRISPFNSIQKCPICGDTSFGDNQDVQGHIASHLVWFSQISVSGHIIPESFNLEHDLKAHESRSTLFVVPNSDNSAEIASILEANADEDTEEVFQAEELSGDISGPAPDLGPHDTQTWKEVTAKTLHSDYNLADDNVIQTLFSAQKPDLQMEPIEEDSTMVGPAETTTPTKSAVSMAPRPEAEITWDAAPVWDPYAQKYYWEGVRLEGRKRVRKYARLSTNFDANGNPLPDMRPPSMGASGVSSIPTVQDQSDVRPRKAPHLMGDQASKEYSDLDYQSQVE
ncbi:hypothetical protein M406DRAFT_331931 [Cryphonectria parasitica EP155]|uniref:C2H2-type domain-containing protein n=1 Tax=Cryphonectria parasitica (strain ATCC 38755 / EP155) TaxID=660469 RepID=A0A9P4XZJ4_CRYP1|nr:uncharacterized protein M406DRAFT_331931 [Cryphonectria parasitica EP155]KAF3763410.1 hypothetical protein M406DRAFT_331931 [Cryphonectria parasitica EP155]